jgi:hypothetical protein
VPLGRVPAVCVGMDGGVGVCVWVGGDGRGAVEGDMRHLIFEMRMGSGMGGDGTEIGRR